MRDGTVALLAAAALTIGCSTSVPSPSPPAGIRNAVVAGEPFAVPGPSWKVSANGRWWFERRATLVYWIPPSGVEHFALRLRPSRSTRSHHFRVFIDDEPVATRTFGADSGQIALEGDHLLPGHHVLLLARRPRLDPATSRQQTRNVFVDLRLEHEGVDAAIPPTRRVRDRQLTDFLQLGVTGPGRERHSGLLFVGPGRYELEPAMLGAGTLVLEPENLSGQPATFRSGAMSLTVAAGDRRTVELTLPARPNAVLLEVDGSRDGLFLWGMPFLRPHSSLPGPPIILVTLDTTRRDALGAYGAGAQLTPHLDALARTATVFDHAVATAPWTLPTHASIFTGLYPSKHRAGVSSVRLPPEPPTLAGELRRHGYFTIGISAGRLSSSAFGLARDFHLYRDPDGFESRGGSVADQVDDLLRRYGDRPLFLFVNYFDPHGAYQAPAEFERRLGVPATRSDLAPQAAWQRLLEGTADGMRDLAEGRGEVTPELLAFVRAAYLAEVAYSDDAVGRLVATLRDLELFDRALIVVAADHGELLGEGGAFTHSFRLDPELLDIPLLLKEPLQTTGRREQALVSQVDLFPTILGLVGLVAPTGDGRTLPLPTLAASTDGPRRYALFEEHASVVHPLDGPLRVAAHLFGIQRSGERQVLWDDQHVCAHLEGGSWKEAPCTGSGAELLRALREQLGPSPDTATGAEEIPEELAASLRALGYL